MLRRHHTFYLACTLGISPDGLCEKRSAADGAAAIHRDGCHLRVAGCAAVPGRSGPYRGA